ncbi:MAG: hypothetical protein ABSC88_11900 [Terracidiphilus sp.]
MTVAIPFLTVLSALVIGCASQDSVQSLENRVAALEEKQKALEDKQKAKEAADQERQDKLEECVKIDADDVYWTYIRLNGKPVANKPGTYTAPQYQWDQAEKQKRDKIEECKLLYGPR